MIDYISLKMTNNNQIKAVFFDAADTLFFIKDGLGTTYSRVASNYGASPDPQKIKSSFSKAFSSAPPLTFPGVSPHHRRISEKNWWYRVVKNVFEDVGMFDNFDSYFDELFEVFRTEAWELFPETMDVLSTLRKSGYKLGIISNFDTRVYDVCEKLAIYGYFGSFVISSEAGYAKPSPEIFSMALRKQGVNPSESIHIGDSIEHDIKGARTLGIEAVLLDRGKKYDHRQDITKINNLKKLISLLEKDNS